MKKSRIYFSFTIFLILYALVVLKAFKVQILDSEKLVKTSNSQMLRKVKIYPNRGTIYDRNGEPLAINIQTYSLFTIPKLLKGNYISYKKLSYIIPKLKYNEIRKKIHKRQKYTWLARNIRLTRKQVDKIDKLDGIFIQKNSSRFYPNHELLAQSLGFVGVDNSGLSGIEYKLNKKLRGKSKIIKYIKDAKGRPVKFESTGLDHDSTDIYLSIDKTLQALSEKYLKEAVIEHKALRGGVGIIDAGSGEILAIANYPTFDPNNLNSRSRGHRKLSFVSDPIEPGSIFKIFTVASAIENKIVNDKTYYYCEQGKLKVQNHIINEAEASHGHEWLSVEEIVKFSSNIGTTKIAFDLKYPRLKRTLEKFRIGRKIGIELPGESRGILTNKKNVEPLALSNISFGQGVATTGIQILGAYAAIANGGIYHHPTMLKKDKPGEGERILRKETAEKLEGMLIKAVSEGTGGNAKIKNFIIAGKTSTAQKAIKGEGYKSAYIPGFIGYPVNIKKRFVVYVYIEEPGNKQYYGNAVAAPVFKKITQAYLFHNKEYDHWDNSFAQDDKNVIDSIKTKQAAVRINSRKVIPSFVGLDKKSSNKLAMRLNLKIKTKGIGIAKKQYPSAGAPIKKNTTVVIHYGPPSYE